MKILDFPQFVQTYEYDCGAKILQSILAYYGIEILEKHLMIHAKTCTRVGTFLHGITSVLKKYGLEFESREMTIIDLKKYIEKKIPVIILVQAWSYNKIDYPTTYKSGHWVAAIGYSKNRIIFEDPYSFKRTYLTNKELDSRWHSKQAGKKILHHGIAVLGGKPAYNSKKIVHMD